MRILLLVIAVFLLNCSNDGSESQNNSEWLISSSEVFDGGPGKDGIPSVDSPKFDSVSESDLQDKQLVIGVVIDGEAKVYPHPILDWHEIINDEIGGVNFALTYCPLTGTGIGWKGNVDGQKTTFGVSGKLYNTNLIPYDRATDSYWTQIGLECVNGESIGEKIATIPVIETTWGTWKQAYPNSLVMNTNTGFSRNYGSYPYGDYRTNDSNIIFPVSNLDSSLPAKERVLALISESTTKVYSLELFNTGKVIEDNFEGEDIVVVGSKANNFIVAYKKEGIGSLSYVEDALPIIAQDQNGNNLNLDGSITSSNSSVNLETVNSFMSYFFALGSFYNVDIYE